MSRPILRFAPSPNGELHLGHAYSALLNFDLARSWGGRFLLRIEDIDTIRCTPEFEAGIYRDLEWLGIEWEKPPRRQSEHFAGYRAALNRLIEADLVYPAFMSRGEIRAHIIEREAAGEKWPRDPDGAPLYPALDKRLSSRQRRERIESGRPYAWRLDMEAAIRLVRQMSAQMESRGTDQLPPLRPGYAGPPLPPPEGEEGSQGLQVRALPLPRRTGERWFAQQTGVGVDPFDEALAWRELAPDLSTMNTIPATPERWGDVIIARSDIPTSYHLSVVLDDALQGVTHVVRGEDLYEATSVHRVLQVLLDLPEPIYRHHRLVLGPDGRKLSKSERSTGLRALREAGTTPDQIREQLGLT